MNGLYFCQVRYLLTEGVGFEPTATDKIFYPRVRTLFYVSKNGIKDRVMQGAGSMPGSPTWSTITQRAILEEKGVDKKWNKKLLICVGNRQPDVSRGGGWEERRG